MLGEAAGLGSALAFALGSAFTIPLSRRMSAFSLNGWRALFATFLYMIVLTILGKWGELVRIPLPALLAFLGSLVIGMTVGGTLYIHSLKAIGLSRAMPIVSTQPLFTSLIAILFLSEALSWNLALSLPLVILGVWLLAAPPQRTPLGGAGASASPSSRRMSLRGVAMALGTALCWAIGASLLKPAVAQADLIASNVLRMGLLALILLSLAGPRRGLRELKALPRKDWLRLLAISFLENGLSSYFYILAVREAGVTRTTLLSSTAPLFALPLGLIFLGERLTARKVLGTLLCTLAIVLIFL